MNGYYLTQRLTSRSTPLADGFDANFEMDYMGSSEYEFGAAHTSLNKMRGDIVVVATHGITHAGITRTVYFVGNAAGLEAKMAGLQSWLDSKHQAKERTNFPEVFAGTASEWVDTDAWWSFTSDVMFALTAEIAERLAHSVNTRPAPKA